MIEPAMTVVIPTRERCDVLEKTLRTVTAQNYDNLEIIVSDNFSGDATEQVVRSANDERVRYINTGSRLSMSHNWEFALSHVAGEWVTILGDDDGLLPSSLSKVAEIIRSTDTRAIRSSVCFYHWPSLIGREFGRLDVPLRSGNEIRDAMTWLSKVMHGQAHYSELPMLYAGGFASTSVLQIKERTGRYYSSCAPDIYSAVSVASVVGSYVYSSEPLAINGASRHSTGTAQYAVADRSDQSPLHKVRSEPNIPFHEDIPVFADGSYPPSIEAVVYESYLQSAAIRSRARASMHRQQLELILARSGKHGAAIEKWGQLFAAAHGLDYEAIRTRADRMKSMLALTSVPARISRAFNTYRVGSPELPITDVYEASVAAAAVRSAMPGRLQRLPRLMGRALEASRALLVSRS